MLRWGFACDCDQYLFVLIETQGGQDQRLGREVKVTWRGKERSGIVYKNYAGQYGEIKWQVRYDDSYVATGVTVTQWDTSETHISHGGRESTVYFFDLIH